MLVVVLVDVVALISCSVHCLRDANCLRGHLDFNSVVAVAGRVVVAAAAAATTITISED